MRSLFIYWKTACEHAADAEAAVRAMQAALRKAHPSLQAALYRRADDSGTSITLMETYALPGDVNDGLNDGMNDGIALQIEQAATALARWRDGPRHVEAFDELPR